MSLRPPARAYGTPPRHVVPTGRAARTRRPATFLLAALLLGFAPAQAQTARRVVEVHAAARAFDPHIDIPATLGTAATAEGQFDIARARAGGLSVAGLAVFAPQGPDTPEGRATALAEAEKRDAAIEALVAANPQALALARSHSEIIARRAEGRTVVVKTLLNAGAFAPTPSDLDRWIERGARIIGFAHAGHNALADSSRPSLPRGDGPARWNGLSPAGRAAVTLLNERGVVIDVSQLSDAAFDDVLRLSRAPVVASHSAARALVANGRNLSDAQLDAIKANGGVVAIVAFSAYLRPRPAAVEAKLKALQAEFGLTGESADALPEDRQKEYTRRYYEIRATEPRATVADLVNHIDHVARRIGVGHVAIASDFNHGGGVEGWSHVGEAPAITAELLKRGYSAEDIARIWSGNLLRVLRDAEAVKFAHHITERQELASAWDHP